MRNRPVLKSEFDLMVREIKALRRRVRLLENEHTPTMPVYAPDLPDDGIEGQHAFTAIRPRYFIDGVWQPRMMYPIPVAPATEPDDFGEQGDGDYPLWQAPWTNIGDVAGEPVDPTAFTMFFGQFWINVAATGGEDTPNSLMFTCTDGYRPASYTRRFGRVGTTGESIAAIDVYPDGRVVYVNSIAF